MKNNILFVALMALVIGVAGVQAQEVNSMAQRPVVVFETNQGEIEIELMPDVAPKTCENMLGLIKKKYYDGIIFHRVIPNFMVQGGDPTGTGRGGESLWGKPFEDEVSADVTFSEVGLLAMANAGPNTNGSQFFITTSVTPWLDGNHTIFGRVSKGYAVVQKIESTETGFQDKPVEEQKIIRAYVKPAADDEGCKCASDAEEESSAKA